MKTKSSVNAASPVEKSRQTIECNKDTVNGVAPEGEITNKDSDLNKVNLVHIKKSIIEDSTSVNKKSISEISENVNGDSIEDISERESCQPIIEELMATEDNIVLSEATKHIESLPQESHNDLVNYSALTKEISECNPYFEAGILLNDMNSLTLEDTTHENIVAEATAPPCSIDSVEDTSNSHICSPLLLNKELVVNVELGIKTLSHLLKLPSTKNIEAYNENDLKTIYHNVQLENKEAVITKFIEDDKITSQHEFYELLQNYYRSRINQLSSYQELEKLDSDVFSGISLAWQFESHSIIEEGICEDDTPVEVEHQYETATYDENIATNITKTMKQLREVVFETHSHHCYNSEMSRILVENYIQKVSFDVLFMPYFNRICILFLTIVLLLMIMFGILTA